MAYGLHFKSLGTVGNGVKKSPLIIAAVGLPHGGGYFYN